MIKQILLLLLACWAILAEAAGHKPLSEKGEFIARSFILTQQSLLKAPYRYAGILRDVLDRVEAKQPPEQSDEQNCDVRYRIEPSGKSWNPPHTHCSILFKIMQNQKIYIQIWYLFVLTLNKHILVLQNPRMISLGTVFSGP